MATADNGDVPQEAIDYLMAVRHIRRVDERAGITRRLTNADLCGELHVPPRTWDKRKHDLRHKWGRDYLEVWPPPPDWSPVWETEIKLRQAELPGIGERIVVAPAVDDQRRPVLIEEVFDGNGISKVRRIVDKLPAFAAVITATTLMDVLSDGRLDGIVRFVRLCLRLTSL